MKPYITDCWDTVARPVVIYSIVSQPEARILYLALHNCIHAAGSCSTIQESLHLLVTPPPRSFSTMPSAGRVSHAHPLYLRSRRPKSDRPNSYASAHYSLLLDPSTAFISVSNTVNPTFFPKGKYWVRRVILIPKT